MKNKILVVLIGKYLLISSIIIVFIGITGEGVEVQGVDFSGFAFLRPFTNLSNILMGIIGGVVAYLVIKFDNNENDLPSWAYTIALMGTTAVSLTCVTVLIFLSPMQMIHGGSYFDMFKSSNLFFHLINPVLAFILTTFLLKGHEYSDRECAIAVIPTIAYSAVYITATVILKSWPDFYGFTFGGKIWVSPISMIVMYSVSYGIALFIRKVHNKKS